MQIGLKGRETVKTSRKPVNYTGGKHLHGEGRLNQNPLILIVTQGQLSPSQAPGIVHSRDVVIHTYAVRCCNLPLLNRKTVVTDFLVESFPRGNHTQP